MDGRSSLEEVVKIQKGILIPFRNVGCRFDLSWPYFQEMVLKLVGYAINCSRNVVVIITYHYSEGEPSRGCKGFGFDTEAAIAEVMALREQYLTLFGGWVLPVIWGIETDSDALILHGAENERVRVDPSMLLCPDDDIFVMLSRLYPSASKTVIKDLIPLIKGNIAYQNEISAKGKDLSELNHAEEVIAIGWRFDSLTQKNKVLTVGPFDSQGIDKAIVTAVDLLRENIAKKRIEGDELLLMTSMPFRDETGPEKTGAAFTANHFAKRGLKVIQKYAPELISVFKILVLTTNMTTRYAEVIEFNP